MYVALCGRRSVIVPRPWVSPPPYLPTTTNATATPTSATTATSTSPAYTTTTAAASNGSNVGISPAAVIQELAALGRTGSRAAVRKLHRQVLKWPQPPPIEVVNSIARAYGECGAVDAAVTAVLRDFSSVNFNVGTLNALLYAQSGSARSQLRRPPRFTLDGKVKKTEMNSLKEAQRVVERFGEVYGIEPDADTVVGLARCAAVDGNAKGMASILDNSALTNLLDNGGSDGFGGGGTPGDRVHSSGGGRGFGRRPTGAAVGPASEVFELALTVFGSAGLPERALASFDALTATGAAAKATHWNMLARSYGRSGQPEGVHWVEFCSRLDSSCGRPASPDALAFAYATAYNGVKDFETGLSVVENRVGSTGETLSSRTWRELCRGATAARGPGGILTVLEKTNARSLRPGAELLGYLAGAAAENGDDVSALQLLRDAIASGAPVPDSAFVSILQVSPGEVTAGCVIPALRAQHNSGTATSPRVLSALTRALRRCRREAAAERVVRGMLAGAWGTSCSPSTATLAALWDPEYGTPKLDEAQQAAYDAIVKENIDRALVPFEEAALTRYMFKDNQPAWEGVFAAANFREQPYLHERGRA